MIIDVTHETRYEYQAPVLLEDQTIRLKPRPDGTQRLLDFTLTVNPDSASVTEVLDVNDNVIHRLGFNVMTPVFEITTRARVETWTPHPVRTLMEHQTARLPYQYPDELRRALGPYLNRTPTPAPVAAYGEDVANRAGWETITFLETLAQKIRDTHRYEIRPEGMPNPAAATLELGRGACRDLSVLFIACARHAGLASRFVSGYHVKDDTNRGVDLHAWVEVYLPGVGWRGYDPTSGRPVGERHVAVAAAPDALGAAPVAGTFRGPVVNSRLTTRVDARPAPAGSAANAY